jgi:hypothetical protein
VPGHRKPTLEQQLAELVQAEVRKAIEEERERLRAEVRSGTIVGPMMQAAKVRHSAASSRSPKARAFAKVANAAGHTLRSVAEAVRRKFGQGTHVNIGRALRGDRAIQKHWAQHIQELTRSEDFPDGWEATPENWPGGWSRD